MKRFSSRFEKVRHLRAQQEDVCRAAAAARNAEREAIERRCHEIQKALNSAETLTAHDMNRGVTGALLHSMASEIEHLRHQISLANEALRKAEDRLNLALQEYKQARAELKIVEEVIHREHKEYRHEQLRIEEHQLQEQAVQTYYRNMEVSRDNES